MVNFVLGTGFLGIPFGFFRGGLVAGFCTLLVVALIAWLCALWELEGMARAQVNNIICLINMCTFCFYFCRLFTMLIIR